MKILSCFSDLKEIAPLAAAGAQELYCAVPELPSFGDSASLQGRGALKAAVRAAHGRGLKLSLAVNSLETIFSRAEEPAVLSRLAAADAAGVDAFIVSSPSFLALLAKLKPRARLHLSSVQPCFNSLTAEMFLSLGVSRIILPNQLSPYEARRILKLCRGRGVETEIFDYRFFGCAYINGRCHLHRPEYYTAKRDLPKGSMCRLAADMPLPRPVNVDASLKGRIGPVAARLAGRFACGGAPRISNMASFFDFYSAGVGYLKYGIRQDSSELKVKKVAELRAMADLAAELSAAWPRPEARRRFIRAMEGWDAGKF